MSVANTRLMKYKRRLTRTLNKKMCDIPTVRRSYMTRNERRELEQRKREWMEKLRNGGEDDS